MRISVEIDVPFDPLRPHDCVGPASESGWVGRCPYHVEELERRCGNVGWVYKCSLFKADLGGELVRYPPCMKACIDANTKACIEAFFGGRIAMIEAKGCPCRECTAHAAGCHSRCDLYKKWAERHEERKRACYSAESERWLMDQYMGEQHNKILSRIRNHR